MSIDPAQLVTEYRRADLDDPQGATVAFERFTQPSGLNQVVREVLAPSVRT